MREQHPDMVIVAYLGPKASYTHQITVNSFDDSRYNLRDEVSIRDVFNAVQTNAASFGVVPFENSSNGFVQATLDLLIDRDNDFPDNQVCGEAYLPVQHCLLGYIPDTKSHDKLEEARATDSMKPTYSRPYPRDPKTKPLTNLDHIKTIYSHPQAFGQCEAFLSVYLKEAGRIDVSSTSKAARIVAEESGGSGDSAAISSQLAADVNDLKVLASGIQDVVDNTTRFLVLKKRLSSAPLPKKFDPKYPANANKKGLVAFSINHKTQGSLADALLVFKRHTYNLTSINTRPSRIRPWHYMFLVELEDDDQLERPEKLCKVLEELKGVTEEHRWLGYWLDRLGA